MTPTEDFHARIARIALSVADKHGFALGGGLALVAHGVLQRPTEDVDLFSDQDGGVLAALDLVVTALQDAGLDVEAEEDTSDLDGVIEQEDVVAVSRRVDEASVRQLAPYGLDEAAVEELRRRFAGWPRDQG